MINSLNTTTILLIFGDGLDADIITHKLQLSPLKVTRKGEFKRPSLSDGAGRTYDSRFELDCWKCMLTSKQSKCDLSTQLGFWIEKLYPHRSSFKDFKDLGYWSVIDCQLIVTEYRLPSVQFRLSQDLQLKLFKLGIDLDFTVGGCLNLHSALQEVV